MAYTVEDILLLLYARGIVHSMFEQTISVTSLRTHCSHQETMTLRIRAVLCLPDLVPQPYFQPPAVSFEIGITFEAPFRRPSLCVGLPTQSISNGSLCAHPPVATVQVRWPARSQVRLSGTQHLLITWAVAKASGESAAERANCD